MITIKNLTKRFGEQTLFSDLNLTIKPGEIVAIIGPSGTGKSTLLRTINSLEQADAGSITINDVSLHYPKTNAQQRLALRQQTGFVFQNYALFQHLTAKENIAESLITVKKWSKQRAYKIALNILQEIGLADKADFYPIALSGGQQQRIGIGRAMAQQAELLLFDEPTSALDPQWVGEVLLLIKK